MLSHDKAVDFAQDVFYHYCKLMVPYYNDYIVSRTQTMFAKIIEDEIDIYFNGKKNQSSLTVATDYGISKMISDIFVTFIQPLYNSHFQHNSNELDYSLSRTRINSDDDEDDDDEQPQKKRVSINTDANTVHVF